MSASTAVYGKFAYEYEPGLNLLSSSPCYAVDRVKTFQMEVGDVVVATYPKAGTTWMQEIVSQIHLRGDEEATKFSILERAPHMELAFPEKAGVEILCERPSPRLMKSHLPPTIFKKQLSENKAKFIIVMRNVKDSLVSYYHFHRATIRLPFDGSWDTFFQVFKAKQLNYGDWLNTNLGWWEYKNHPNVLIVKYEDMKRNRKAAIRKVAEFCCQPLSDTLVDKITEGTSFEVMKENPATNLRKDWHQRLFNFDISSHIRKGEVGGWKEYFTKEQDSYVEEYYVKEAAKHGLLFDHRILEEARTIFACDVCVF